jgi:nucleoside-diphosphate-sugar epimerase
MRIVVTGASGNVGTAVVRALSADDRVGEITGLVRRAPDWGVPKLRWVTADLGDDDPGTLDAVLAGADAVIHLAWLFQPARQPVVTWETNVLGSLRVFEAVARNGVPALVHTSSVGAYSPGPKDRPVDEGWPTHGWPAAAYTREKAYVERALDAFESRHPRVRVVRMRPAFLFQRASASGQRRLFAGPLLPNGLVRPGLIPVVPDLPGLRVQVLHTDDAAEAYRLAVTGDARGPFNLAADPVVDAGLLAELLGARVLRSPAWPVRAAVAAAFRLRLAPAAPELFDAVLRMPVMDTTRARTELGWTPRHDATAVMAEFLAGLRDGAGLPTPPLTPRIPGGRAAELATGMGSRP